METGNGGQCDTERDTYISSKTQEACSKKPAQEERKCVPVKIPMYAYTVTLLDMDPNWKL